jgi:FAD dependent oxidoreductase
MIPNHSPWIKQLNRTRPVLPLAEDLETDVVVVGGGIAGVTTAFFTLRDTDKRVVLIEADKIAHGATGYNAGQITSYFERPLSELVDEFGLELAIDGQKAVESGWMLIDEIVAEASLQTPVYRFTGYAGLTSLEQVQQHLRNNRYRLMGGLQTEGILVAEEWTERTGIGSEYSDLYTLVPEVDLRNLLETTNTEYIAALTYQKGCTNSAVFTEELLGYLSARYPERFRFFEGSPVRAVVLDGAGATLHIREQKVQRF